MPCPTSSSSRPRCRWCANVTAEPTSDPDTIRNQLVEQVTGMVRWRESVANMAEAGVEEFVELGGKVLGSDGQAHRARRQGDERGDDRGHRSAGEGDRVMFDLSGMTALVTGASGGLGSAIAKALAGQGARLAVSGSNVEKLESFPRRSRRRSCRAAVQPVRWSRGRSARSAGGRGAGGKLDILVNNAGVTRDNLLMRMKDEEFEEVIRINLDAAFRLMRAAARPMMKARFGRIISITSVVGVTGNPGQANYVASKAGLIGMTKAVAQELASRNITVNAVAPGFMTSAMTDALNDQQREAILARIPAGAMGSGDDIGAACGLSRVQGSRIRHRADASRQRRNGDAVTFQAGRQKMARLAAHRLATAINMPAMTSTAIMAAVDRGGRNRCPRDKNAGPSHP